MERPHAFKQVGKDYIPIVRDSNGNEREAHDDLFEGVIRTWRVDKGYGFARTSDCGADDVFIHFTALPPGVHELKIGQKVRFILRRSRRQPDKIEGRNVELI